MWIDLTLIVAKDTVQLPGDAPQEESSGKRGKVKHCNAFCCCSMRNIAMLYYSTCRGGRRLPHNACSVLQARCTPRTGWLGPGLPYPLFFYLSGWSRPTLQPPPPAHLLHPPSLAFLHLPETLTLPGPSHCSHRVSVLSLAG